MRSLEGNKRQSLQHARGYQNHRTAADRFAGLGTTLHVFEMNVFGNAVCCGCLLEVLSSRSSSDDRQIGVEAASAQPGECGDSNVKAFVAVETPDTDQSVGGYHVLVLRMAGDVGFLDAIQNHG